MIIESESDDDDDDEKAERRNSRKESGSTSVTQTLEPHRLKKLERLYPKVEPTIVMSPSHLVCHELGTQHHSLV